MEARNNSDRPERGTSTTKQGQSTPPASDAELLAKFADDIAEERRQASEVVAGFSADDGKPVPFDVHHARYVLANDSDTPERRLADLRKQEQWEANREERQRRELQAAKAKLWESYLADRGNRYAKCRLANYVISCDAQQRAIDIVREYCRTVADKVADGIGLVLVGPSGTGKDHMMTAIVFAAIARLGAVPEYGNGEERIPFTVAWTSGPKLFGDMRAAIGEDESQERIIRKYTNASLLAMSDLIPPSGRLTDFQTEIVYRITDERYNHGRPTLLSANVGSRSEMDGSLSVPIVERLLHGAIVIPCDWPSFRKADVAK